MSSQTSAASGARLVFVSTTGVFGRARYREVPTDESVPLPKLPEHEVYGRSKQAAERLVLEPTSEAQCGRPSFGRLSCTACGTVSSSENRPYFSTRVLPSSGWWSFNAEPDACRSIAEGALLVGTNESAGGKIYHLTDDFPITVSDLVATEPKGWAAGCAGSMFLQLWLRWVRILKPLLIAVGRGDLAPHTEGTLDMLTRIIHSHQTAREELGWVPTTRPEVGLPEAFRSWKVQATSSPIPEEAAVARRNLEVPQKRSPLKHFLTER
ncbi:MAG: hypothetical protein Ct9H300mP15_13790 [Gemmatimonadota bacterium]|nr:MAG: hypothetical protein Ct9H300mP15_13790 [Gemmatimonadota bacterium]